MPWKEIRQRILPPIEGVSSHDTSLVKRTKGTSPHVGVDFNYIGGQRAPRNWTHAELRSPVAGIVTNAGGGTAGRIAIKDPNGFTHEILHTHTRRVAVGDPVVPGQLIGTMGNTGVELANVESGDHHVHYQMWDPAGKRVNPAEFWDRRDPAYLGEYEQYLHGRGAGASNGSGDPPGVASTPATGSVDTPSEGSAPLYATENTRYLGRHVAGKPPSSAFDTGTPAVPFVPPNDVLSSEFGNSFNARFRNWTAVPTVPSNESLPDRQNSLDDRFGSWTSSPAGVTPRNPNLPRPPSEPGRPLGTFSGEPMPLWTTQPPIWGSSNLSEAPGAGRWPTAPVGFGDNRKSQAPTIDTRATAIPSRPPTIQPRREASQVGSRRLRASIPIIRISRCRSQVGCSRFCLPQGVSCEGQNPPA